ncbi:hypothetical protein FRC03_003468 [Tulasnella sp. 419]|nr:hypothetical protein FRC02_003423 [Tulasnella sp. 418]KAG8942257.1 hypothetical protein FRC03_003468 [Tulasnella sp. 419]
MYSAMSSSYVPSHIPRLMAPTGEILEVASAVSLGQYSLSDGNSTQITPDSNWDTLSFNAQMESTPFHIYLLNIGNKRFVALIDDNFHCAWLKRLVEIRPFMQAHNFARRYSLDTIPPELCASGPKNEPLWSCRYMVGNKYYMGFGLTKQDAKDEAGLRVLLSYGIDIRTLT